jgi:hypothetical protein
MGIRVNLSRTKQKHLEKSSYWNQWFPVKLIPTFFFKIDIIEMNEQQDGEYKLILGYQDHLTKFVLLRPLESSRCEKVSYVLLEIYSMFGAFSIFRNESGHEFSRKLVEEICSMRCKMKIVHGKLTHIQNQVPVECANGDVENILST